MRHVWMVAAVSLACGPAQTSPQPFIPDVIARGTGEVFRGTFSPTGREFYFFRKVTAGAEDYRVFRTVHRDGVWGPPALLPLGDSTASSMYPVISPDGHSLVVTSSRPADEGVASANLWMLTRDRGDWQDPVLLRGLSTFEQYDASPWFASDGSLHFTSTSADWTTTWYRRSTATVPPFGTWEEDPLWSVLAEPLIGYQLWSGIIDPTGMIAIAEVSALGPDGSAGPSDLWIAQRGDGEWGPLRPLGAGVNTAGTENFPTFTPDGATLVFVRDFAGYFMIARQDLVPASD